MRWCDGHEMEQHTLSILGFFTLLFILLSTSPRLATITMQTLRLQRWLETEYPLIPRSPATAHHHPHRPLPESDELPAGAFPGVPGSSSTLVGIETAAIASRDGGARAGPAHSDGEVVAGPDGDKDKEVDTEKGRDVMVETDSYLVDFEPNDPANPKVRGVASNKNARYAEDVSSLVLMCGTAELVQGEEMARLGTARPAVHHGRHGRFHQLSSHRLGLNILRRLDRAHGSGHRALPLWFRRGFRHLGAAVRAGRQEPGLRRRDLHARAIRDRRGSFRHPLREMYRAVPRWMCRNAAAVECRWGDGRHLDTRREVVCVYVLFGFRLVSGGTKVVQAILGSRDGVD